MSNSDLTSILFVLLLLVGLAQLLGHVFVWLRQPKVVGEIAAGIILGPSLVGRLPYGDRLTQITDHQGAILNFVYWLGLLMLMFLSGAETRNLFTREERSEVGNDHTRGYATKNHSAQAMAMSARTRLPP